MLAAKRAVIFYKLPAPSPELVHHSFSQVQSRVHRLHQETDVYATFKHQSVSKESCIMTLPACCFNSCYKVQLTGTAKSKQSFHRALDYSSNVSEIVAPILTYFHYPSFLMVHVFTVHCLNCDWHTRVVYTIYFRHYSPKDQHSATAWQQTGQY